MRNTLSILASALLLASTCAPVLSAAHGAVTLYAPPFSAPKPGSLYPRAIELRHAEGQAGYLLATFEEYSNGVPSFPIYRSTNRGTSWKLISRVSDTQNGWGMRFQPFLFELPQSLGSMPAGTILCIGNSIPKDLSQTSLDMYKSLDHGSTWTFVSHVARGGAANPDGSQDPVWEPFVLLANGRLIVYYSDERDPAHNQKIVHQTSVDGLTWGGVVDDVAMGPKRRPGMPIIAKMGNGNYIMSFECVCNGTIYTAVKTSSDPEQWNAADAGATISQAGGTPYVVWMPSDGRNGILIVSSNGDDNLYVNRMFGAPGSVWIPIAAVVGNGYSRSLIALSKMNTLFEISSIAQSSGYNHIVSGMQIIAHAPRRARTNSKIK
jgi:hypothetical protein